MEFNFIEGEVLGILLFGVVGLLWILVPFWDRKSSRGIRNRMINYIGIAAIVFIIILTIIGLM